MLTPLARIARSTLVLAALASAGCGEQHGEAAEPTRAEAQARLDRMVAEDNAKYDRLYVFGEVEGRGYVNFAIELAKGGAATISRADDSSRAQVAGTFEGSLDSEIRVRVEPSQIPQSAKLALGGEFAEIRIAKGERPNHWLAAVHARTGERLGSEIPLNLMPKFGGSAPR